jgi:hypothetical protein
MQLRAMSSLDAVEMVMALEEAFDIEISDGFEGPRQTVDQLEEILSNRRPNKEAAALLKKIARDRQQPELAAGLEGPWRREQIAAMVRELFRGFERLARAERRKRVAGKK